MHAGNDKMINATRAIFVRYIDIAYTLMIIILFSFISFILNLVMSFYFLDFETSIFVYKMVKMYSYDLVNKLKLLIFDTWLKMK